MFKIYKIVRTGSTKYRDFGIVDKKSSTENKIVFLGFGETKVKKLRDNEPLFDKEIDDIKKGKIFYWTYQKGEYGDLASMAALNMFSEKFIELLNKNNITNFKTYPVKVLNKDAPKYYYIEIQCKRIRKYDQKISGKNLVDFSGLDPSWESMNKYRNYFDLDEWGGEDLFTIEGTKTIMCTEKVKNLVEKNKLKNFKFEELKNEKE
jgi:hypothetical protein